MLSIKFHTDSDAEDYSQAIKEYEKIWNSCGEKIFESWERHTGFKFRETYINAMVINATSRSFPLTLRADNIVEIKKGTLIHELGHRILARRIKGRKGKLDKLSSHKFLDLFLTEVIEDVFGKKMVEITINFEKTLPPEYAQAWDWALKLTPEEKKFIFKRVVEGDVTALN